MGGSVSAAGLKLMEELYPSDNGQTIFTNPKLAQKLEKELGKRGISLDDIMAEEDYVDGDMDADIDRCIQKIFQIYDRKGTGSINKKLGSQFFVDCLELYALRKGQKKGKDCLGPSVNMKKATEECWQLLSNGGSMVNLQQFTEFLNCYDIDEALHPFLGSGNTQTINISVEYVNCEAFVGQARDGPKLVYRDYPDD
eukprot:TRINITY_DN2624_c0_g2_i1.p1 TRINITY_DN2624_c0_g2~~TRINITY_DN2624_c0_g2_i1.p1  ORF type:complete len:205 (-),score=44.58 TRINITY_DN2624_c0_g2_i1:66-656(-)